MMRQRATSLFAAIILVALLILPHCGKDSGGGGK